MPFEDLLVTLVSTFPHAHKVPGVTVGLAMLELD